MSPLLPEKTCFPSRCEEESAGGDPVADADPFWRTLIGLDLAERTVLEGEVLIWRIAQQREFKPHRSA